MSDYQELVRKEANAFFEASWKTYQDDAGEHGSKSAAPSFPRWIDRTEKLTARVNEIAGKWGLRECHWVQTNTRNKRTQGGDPRSNAFASFLEDIRHELKRLAKTG
ncbi:MAG: hypothetical protein HY721_24955 [Planctomycetes bacterium]|nr:hypothetical protein [Planctomycetota bacterium]